MIDRRGFLGTGAMLAGGTLLGAGRAARAQPRNPSWPRNLTMGTAVPGGVYAVFGPAWGQLVQEATGITIDYRATQGPNQNIILVDRRDVEFGMTTMGPALQAWNGQGQWTQGNRYRNIRALFPMYDTPLYGIALRRSGLARYDQLGGRNVGLGPRGATAATYFPSMMEAIGVQLGAQRYGSGVDMVGQLNDGLIQAFLHAAGAPNPSFVEAETSNEINYLAFTPEQVAAIRAKVPELTPSHLPMGTHRTQTADIHTVGLYNFAIVHKDANEGVVYEVVKAVMTGNERLRRAHSAGRDTLPQNWNKNSFLPFHPGAARWFRDNGHAVPDSLIAR